MLSFKELSERKTKIKINPKQSEITEKSCDSKKKCSKCEGKGCKHCGGTGYHGEEEVSEAKKKDDTYLETDFKKRQKNNEKARKDLMKGPQMKNPHFESTNQENAYDSQEEVSEESTEEIAETETLLTFKQFNEDRAADAKASLEKVKARQKVLDAHEKKTGKKLDITKTPEHKAHKKDFPGAKRTGKKVKGAKETDLETHNRRVNRNVSRIVKRGYTSKEKKEVQSMAKHASRYD